MTSVPTRPCAKPTHPHHALRAGKDWRHTAPPAFSGVPPPGHPSQFIKRLEM